MAESPRPRRKNLPQKLGAAARATARDPKGTPRRAAKVYRYQRRKFGGYRRFLRKEMKWSTDWANRKPDWWKRGFLSRSVTLYGLEQGNDPSLYVNDVQRYIRTKKMVSQYLQPTINNKFNFFLLMSSLGLDSDVVPLLGLHVRGKFYAFPNKERGDTSSYLEEVLQENPHVFIKPLEGAEANGVRSLRQTEHGYRLDGQDTALKDVVAWIEAFNKPLILEAAVQQHEFEATLNPQATNTIRVLTMPDIDKNDEPFIARAVHRIGSSRSGHIDNWTKGGLSANIDLETGELSQASRLPEGNELEWFSQHPDNGTQIAGETVPYWEETKQLVLDAAQRLAFLEYVGWDIIISPTGPVILEANINSGMNVLQVHGPLLADERVRRYYRARNAVT